MAPLPLGGVYSIQNDRFGQNQYPTTTLPFIFNQVAALSK